MRNKLRSSLQEKVVDARRDKNSDRSVPEMLDKNAFTRKGTRKHCPKISRYVNVKSMRYHWSLFFISARR